MHVYFLNWERSKINGGKGVFIFVGNYKYTPFNTFDKKKPFLLLGWIIFFFKPGFSPKILKFRIPDNIWEKWRIPDSKLRIRIQISITVYLDVILRCYLKMQFFCMKIPQASELFFNSLCPFYEFTFIVLLRKRENWV